MEYLKHKSEFYKKINLKELWKAELIKLIKEAVEYEPERVTTIIKENNYTYPNHVQYGNDVTCLTDSNLNKMNNDSLMALCNDIR